MNGISLSTYQQCCILTVFFIFLRKRWYHRYSSAGQRRIAMDLACKIQARIGTRRAHGSCFNGKKPYLPFRSLIIYNNYMPKCWVDLSSNLRGIIDFFCLGQNKSRSVQFNAWGRVTVYCRQGICIPFNNVGCMNLGSRRLCLTSKCEKVDYQVEHVQACFTSRRIHNAWEQMLQLSVAMMSWLRVWVDLRLFTTQIFW